MGKQLKEDPLGLRAKLNGQSTDVVEDSTVNYIPTSSKEDPLGLRAQLKKKDNTTVDQSGAESTSPVTSTDSSKPSAQPTTPSSESTANPLQAFVQTIASGLADQLPKEYYTQRLRMSKGSFGDLFDPRSDINAFGQEKLPEEISYDKFRQWNNKQNSDIRSKSYDDRAKLFITSKVGDEGYQKMAEQFQEDNSKKRLGFEKEIQQQNKEAAIKTPGIIQNLKDIHGAGDFLNFAGNMLGQALYRAPVSLLSGGIGSVISESAAVYDRQLDLIAEKEGISREEVIKKGLDKPAEGQVLATLAGGLDAVSSVNMVGLFRKAAQKQLTESTVKQFTKAFIKGGTPEALTEAAQGELEEVGASKGAGVEYSPDAWRIATSAAGGLIGGGGVSMVATQPTPKVIEQEKSKISTTDDHANIAKAADTIVDNLKKEENEKPIVKDGQVAESDNTGQLSTDQGTSQRTGGEPTAVPEVASQEANPLQGQQENKSEKENVILPDAQKPTKDGESTIDSVPPGNEQKDIGNQQEDAETITRSVQEASPSTPGAQRIPRAIKKEQDIELEASARKKGTFIEDVKQEFGEKLDGGTEQDVYESKDGNKVIKVNGLSNHSSWSEFWDRLNLQKKLFPDEAYKLIGFTKEGGRLAAVSEQPYIEGTPVPRQELIEDLAKRGFYQIHPEGSLGENQFYNSELGIRLSDVHGENVIKDQDGNIRYIDPMLDRENPFVDEESKKHYNEEKNKYVTSTPEAGAPPINQPPSAGTNGQASPIYNNQAIYTGKEKTTGANITPELTKKDAKYGTISNDLTTSESKRIVSSNPLPQVEDVVFDRTNDMEDSLRRSTAIELAKAYRASGDMKATARVFGKYRELGTKAAQAVQIGNVAYQDPLVQTMELVAQNSEDNETIRNEVQPDGQKTGKKLADTKSEIDGLANKFGVEVSESETLDTVITKILAKGIPKSERLNIATKRVKDAGSNLRALWKSEQNLGAIWDPKSQAKTQVKLEKALMEYIVAVVNKTTLEIGETAANLKNRILEQVKKFLSSIGMVVPDSDIEGMVDTQIKEADAKRYTPPITQAEREDAISKIKGMLLSPGSKNPSTKPAIQEFYNRLTNRIIGSNPKVKTAEDALIEVTRNLDKYSDVLEGVKNELESEGIDVSEMESIFNLPFFEKKIKNKVIIDDIKNLIKQHYSEKDAAKKSISDKLISDYNLSGKDAKAIQDIVNKEFDAKMKKAVDASLTKLYGTSNLKQPISKTKGDAEKIIEAINMGVFNDEFYTNLVGQRFGISEFTQADIQKLESISDDLQKLPPGELRNNKLRQFKEYIADLNNTNREQKLMDAFMSLWYTSALSGYSTQSRSLKANIVNGLASLMVASLANPVATLKGLGGLKSLYRGWQSFGRGTWTNIVKTGSNPFGQGDTRAISWTQKLTDKSFKELYSEKKYGQLLAKPWVSTIVYMGNGLAATDAMFRYISKENEAYILAYNKLLNEGGSRFEESFWNKLQQELALDKPTLEASQAQLEQEIQALKASGEEIPRGYERRRLQEITDSKRNEDLAKGSIENANRNLLMNDPVGVLGALYRAMTKAGEISAINDKLKDKSWYKAQRKAEMFGKLVYRMTFPFLRIASNQINRNISYTPLGLIHAGLMPGYREVDGPRAMTADERTRHFIMGGIGTTVIAGLAMTLFDDDDEEGLKLDEDAPIQITGLGLGQGKFQENKDLFPDRQDLGFRLKNPITGKWSEWYTYRDAPIGMVFFPLGQASDDLRYKKFKETVSGKNEKERTVGSYLATAGHWAMQFATSQSYQQGIRNALDLIGFDQSGNIEDKAIKAAISPIKAILMPNLYKQTYNQMKSILEQSDKKAYTIPEQIMKDIPLVESLIDNDAFDQLGFPIVKKFDWPLVPDVILDEVKENRDYRMTKPEWQLIYKYPEVTLGERFRAPDKISVINPILNIPTGKVIGLDDKQKNIYTKTAGESLRESIADNLEYLNKLDAIELQKRLNQYRSWALEDARDYFTGGKFGKSIRRMEQQLPKFQKLK